jgi:hypothetical protein
MKAPDLRVTRLEAKFLRVVDALTTQGEHLAHLDVKAEKANTLLEHIVEQLRHMNEGLIRTLTLRGELDDLRARLARLEGRANGG